MKQTYETSSYSNGHETSTSTAYTISPTAAPAQIIQNGERTTQYEVLDTQSEPTPPYETLSATDQNLLQLSVAGQNETLEQRKGLHLHHETLDTESQRLQDAEYENTQVVQLVENNVGPTAVAIELRTITEHVTYNNLNLST